MLSDKLIFQLSLIKTTSPKFSDISEIRFLKERAGFKLNKYCYFHLDHNDFNIKDWYFFLLKSEDLLEQCFNYTHIKINRK